MENTELAQQPLETPAAVPPQPVAMVSRATLNYVIIGVTMFVIGLFVGIVGYDRVAQANRADNRDLADEVADRVVAALTGQASESSRTALDPAQVYQVDTAGDPAIGPEDAPITIIEFGDFNCTYCRRFQEETIQPLLAQYEGRVRFVWRDYPILGQSSVDASVAAECADDQGKFWEMHDLFFTDQANLTRAGFIAKAGQIGIDVEQFTTCYDSRQHEDEIAADYQAGQSLGINGTPTFFINGRPLVGAQPLDVFVTTIESELADG